MPYTIETDDGIEIEDVPDHIKPDAPELRQRVLQARHQRRIASPEFKTQQNADRARLRGEIVGEMSPLEAGVANVSAGVGNLWEGIKQVAGQGSSDEDIREKRSLDASLAENTRGGGALQFVGEVAPTLLIPGGAAARYGTKALMAAGAGGGAAGAALEPVTSDESRASNMGLAAGLGAVIPGVGAKLPKGAKYVQSFFSDAAARERAADAIRSGVGGQEKARVLTQALEAQGPQPSWALPKSAAQRTGDAELANLEAASRARGGTQASWADFTADQNRAKWGALERMTPSELRGQRLERVRDLQTRPMREGALEAAGEVEGFAGPVLAHADNLLTGDTGANPAVRSIANYLKGALGENPTPGRLYEARKVLAAKLGGRPVFGDELSAAAKGAQRETSQLIAAIDDALDSASQGQWRPYLAEYTARSKPVESGKVLRETVAALQKKSHLGDTPEVTYTGFDRALKDEGKYGSRLTPQAQAQTEGYAEELRRIEAAGRTRKLAGTMGGGSNTAMDFQAAKRLGALVLGSMAGGTGGVVLTEAARAIHGVNKAKVEQHIAQLLQSPTELGAALRALPPEQLQAVVAQAAYGSGVVGASALTP